MRRRRRRFYRTRGRFLRVRRNGRRFG
uniref:Uncharacterized protein n=1 Tax=Dulem virus 94 TaxID=3145805 RepID=A0AAU8AXP6_9VIRU